MNESNLHEYQTKAVNHIMKHPFCGLMLDMGLGKTVSSLTAINKLIFEELEISRVLVVAPKRVVESVWSQEVSKWSHLKHLKVVKVNGNEASRERALREKAHVYLISRDNIAWLCGLYGGGMLPFDMLVLDESSSFKSPKSARFKALKRAQSSLNRVVILTGTPVPNGLIDLWSQIYLLDRGERLGKTIGSYRDKYFNAGQRSGAIVYNYRPKNSVERDIHNKISDICMSMKAEDYLKMPDKIVNVIKLDMSEELGNRYGEFEREQVLELMEKDITAVNRAVLSNKLLQFANGAIYDEDRGVHELHSLKLDAAEEVVEAAQGKPVLIAWLFQHDRDRLMTKLKKYKPVQLKTDKHVQDWNAGRIQVMLMHPASGGHGLNLQSGGNTVLWFGNNWSLELEQQLNARLYRQGQQASKVFIHKLALRGTLDEKVISRSEGKARTQDDLMEAIKALIKKYEGNRK